MNVSRDKVNTRRVSVMIKTIVFSIFLSIFIVSVVGAHPQHVSELDRQAKLWLMLVDEEKYEKSWQEADDLFKAKITQQQWQQALIEVRQPLGNVISRDQVSSKVMTLLSGIADGEYHVLQFQSVFQGELSAEQQTHDKHINAVEVLETLTLSKASGQWLIIGYFIKE